jgi:hypothetical protein
MVSEKSGVRDAGGVGMNAGWRGTIGRLVGGRYGGGGLEFVFRAECATRG